MVDPQTETVSVFGDGPDNDLWPFTLLEAARSFAAAADATVARLGQPDAGGSHYLTVLFLLSQAIENALKAYLLIHGVSESELRQIGHDLPRVLSRAEAANWRTQHPADRFLLKLIDGCYRKQKQLQYHRASEMTLPLLHPVRELAHSYINRLPAPFARNLPGNAQSVTAATAGWSIDPEADYSGPTLAEFRLAAPPSGELSDLRPTPDQ